MPETAARDIQQRRTEFSLSAAVRRIKSMLPGLGDLRKNIAKKGWRVWAGWFLVLPFFCWVVFRGIGLERGFPLIQIVAFTPYVFVLGFLSFLSFLIVVLLRQWPAALVALMASVGLGLAVIPRALGGPDQVDGAGRTPGALGSKRPREIFSSGEPDRGFTSRLRVRAAKAMRSNRNGWLP
ncbi:MAG: hypothetical protein IPK93_05170 [Solirubrobacterales bacterium]|nr:hypothetical protein [Solirubrobacterales bacterium]